MGAEAGQGVCAGYACGDDHKLRSNAEALFCKSEPCGAEDLDTCCRALCTAQLYDSGSFGGTRKDIKERADNENGDWYNMKSIGFNDKTSSIILVGDDCKLKMLKNDGNGNGKWLNGPGSYGTSKIVCNNCLTKAFIKYYGA